MNDYFYNNAVGIPRAISYYNNYPFYHGFFTTLGLDIVLSDKTTSKLINSGAQCVVSDTCLPIKVFVGHVINLLDKGCNTIFVPSLQSTGFKINNCSKIRGLPEIIRNVINRPFKMIEPTLDKTENIGFKDFCNDTANQLGIYDEELINKAITKGWELYDNFLKMAKLGVNYQEAIDCAINEKPIPQAFKVMKPLSVVLMAHGYNLFDERISLNLIKKLNKMGVMVYTSLDINKEEAIEAIYSIGEIQYWANELDLTGTAAHFLNNNTVDGIIALSAFGCGPDSLMVDEMKYHAQEKEMPMMHLTIDEHTGEAGFVTRLEAFVDMIFRRKRKLNDRRKVVDISNKNKQKVVAEEPKERILTLVK